MMTVLNSVIETNTYLSAARRLMSEEERAAVVDVIAADPESGVVVQGTGGLRKMRIALRGRGKRGGGRVIYWYRSEGYPAVLLTVYAKSEAADLTLDQLRRFAAVGAAIVDELGASR
jgi:hypothetical protein